MLQKYLLINECNESKPDPPGDFLQAGEYIDLTVGVAIGISTMAAAGLGNTISDVAGVGLGGFVESVATKMGLPPINLSRYVCVVKGERFA